MPRCPSCLTETDDAARFCPGCGDSLSSFSQAQTFDPRSSDAAARAPAVASGRPAPASGPVLLGGFAPGTMLAGRYRIVGLVPTAPTGA